MGKKIPVGKICCYTDEDSLKSVKNENCYGFRLGVQLMAEPFLLPIGENKKTTEMQIRHR